MFLLENQAQKESAQFQQKKSNFVDLSPEEDEGNFRLYLSDCEIEKDFHMPTSNLSEGICFEIPETSETTEIKEGKLFQQC
jgi:hypothetical protein